MKHVMYYGHHSQGLMLVPFAKCVCGAYLRGQEQIDAHRALIGATA